VYLTNAKNGKRVPFRKTYWQEESCLEGVFRKTALKQKEHRQKQIRQKGGHFPSKRITPRVVIKTATPHSLL
jgi:hypothetical protein